MITHPGKTLILGIVILSAMAAFAPETADALLMNTDFKNTTGNVVNDYHIKLVSKDPINITATFEFGGDVQFNPPAITGNNSTSVSLDFSGATVNSGQSVHIGFSDPNNLGVKVAESYWTLGGVEVLPRIGMVSAGFSGISSDFLVARVLLYDDPAGSDHIGTMWWANQSEFVDIGNYTTEPVYASVSYARFSDLIELEDLNEALEGFGPDSPIQYYEPVPEPSSLMLVLAGIAGIALIRRLKPFDS